MQAKISVVMCCYNGEEFLREQLDSVLRQTQPAFEIIVRDDASSDGTWALLQTYASQYPCIIPSRNAANLGFKRNFALALADAQGDYIAYCDQDDIWCEHHLAYLLQLIQGKDLAVGNALLVDAQGRSLGFSLREEFCYRPVAQNEIDKLYPIFYRSSLYQGASMLLTKRLKQALLPIPEAVAFHDVWTAALACCMGGINDSDEIITLYRQHGNNVTKHHKASLWRELKMRHHFCYAPDRMALYEGLMQRLPERSTELDAFLAQWKHYADLCRRPSDRCKAFRLRFGQYKKIYTTGNYRYFCLRALHWLLTPPFKTASN